jgi:peptidoglycan/LPS O-acetylase OafA/YrhL
LSSSVTLPTHGTKPLSTSTAALAAKRDPSIDIARLCAAFLIVLFHAGESYSMAGGPDIGGNPPWLIVGNLSLWGRVPFFFFLAGCFAARSLAKPGASAGGFVSSRIKGLGIPYLFWNGVSLAMLWVALRAGASFSSEPVLTTGAALGKLTGIFFMPANGPLWFIRDLILASLLAPLLRKLGPWLLVPSISLIILPEIPLEWMERGCPRPSSFGYFGIGMLLSYLPKGTFGKLFPNLGLGLLLCLSLGVVHSIWHLTPSRFGGVSVGAMGILLTGCYIHRSFPRIAEFMARHSSASFIVFAANVPFFAVARFLYPRVEGKIGYLPYFFGLAVLFFVLALVAHHLIRGYFPRLLVLISGGR